MLCNLLEKDDMSFLVDSVIRNQKADNYKWRYALVGNYIPDSDTNIFAPYTKVYCCPIGTGKIVEHFWAIGKTKENTNTFIETIVPCEQIINLRLRKVFNPDVLELMDDSPWPYYDDSAEGFKAITSLLLTANPLYIIHKGDKKYSLDTGENDQLKKDIHKSSKAICKFLCHEIKSKEKYSIPVLQKLENEINLYKWTHIKSEDFLDMCACYLGDFIIHNFGGYWSVVNKRLCIMITNRTCVFTNDLIKLYYCSEDAHGLETAIHQIKESVL